DEPTAGRPVVEGESFARPFTRRNRASSAASEEDTATLMPEGGAPRAAEAAGAGADWRGGGGGARHPLPAALDAADAASDGNGSGEDGGRGRAAADDRLTLAEREALVQAAASAEEPGSAGSESQGPLLQLRDWGKASRYRMPPPSLLELPRPSRRAAAPEPDRSQKLEEALSSFGVEARGGNVSRGPVITRYELQPGPGVKVSKITSLVDDL